MCFVVQCFNPVGSKLVKIIQKLEKNVEKEN